MRLPTSICAFAGAVLLIGLPALALALAQLTVTNSSPYTAHVWLYSERTGGHVAFETIMKPGARSVWALEGPRAIRVHRIEIKLSEGQNVMCTASEPTDGKGGHWVIRGLCRLGH